MNVLQWSTSIGAAGQRICVPPGGRGDAWIEVRDRVKPVPFPQLVAQRIDQLRRDGASDVVADPAQRLVTREGEHAAITTIRASATIEHSLAAIYGDDFAVEIDGRAIREHHAAVREFVSELARELPLGLGEQRHRRYLYRRPEGWRGIARGLVTTWIAEDATMKVLPARPVRMDPRATQLDAFARDDSFAGFKPEGQLVRDDADFEPFTCVITRALGRFDDELHGDARRMVITAGLMDGRFVYGLRLDSGEQNAAEHERAFLELVRSVEKVPLPRPSQSAETFAQWMT